MYRSSFTLKLNDKSTMKFNKFKTIIFGQLSYLLYLLEINFDKAVVFIWSVAVLSTNKLATKICPKSESHLHTCHSLSH